VQRWRPVGKAFEHTSIDEEWGMEMIELVVDALADGAQDTEL
jgi:hypothetical protein